MKLRLKRCAAVLQVAAGSHDVPLAWPGLAHFLEHLLFLGTERFPAGEGLMAYVQRLMKALGNGLPYSNYYKLKVKLNSLKCTAPLTVA